MVDRTMRTRPAFVADMPVAEEDKAIVECFVSLVGCKLSVPWKSAV